MNNSIFHFIFGNLTAAAFQQGDDLFVVGAQISMIVFVLVVFILLWRYKRFQWLWKEWLTSLDPKRIGVMYLVVASLMLLRGLMDAGMMRAQQAVSVGANSGFFSPERFQQIFSSHGAIMIFFVAMGLMFGTLNLILPLQIGSRDVAFPFLNSTSFWLYIAGAFLINISLAIGTPSAAGWLSYPPLSELVFSPGVGVDYWIWSLQIAGIGSLLSGINFLVTIIKMRCKGMTLMRMPMFVWSTLGALALVIFAFPILTGTLGMLFADRTLGMHFFTADMGGNAMMYVNLIWSWGHPEVYILILPAFGIFSEVVPTFSQKRLFGYTSMVWAIVAITFLSFTVWLHHFFTMGAGADVNAFFGIMTMIIAIPTGVKVFNWLFTMFRGRVHLTVPMLWFLGFIVTFTIGGMAGVMMAIPAVDFELHNSLFLVAHFHTMIIGGVVFGYFAGFNYWFPKFSGWKLNEKLGKWAFWLWLIGFVLAFVPLYILGLMGATRRLDHYDPSMGWQGLFIVAALGVCIIVLAVIFQIIQLIVSYRQHNLPASRDVNGGDPWNGRTLEWSVPSPVPFYNFAVLPEVSARDPWWEEKQKRLALTNDENSASAGTVIRVAEPHYEDIYLPRNSSLGIWIGIFAALFGFAVVWHIFWLIAVAFVAIIACIIIRTFDEDTEYCLKAEEVRKLEMAYNHN
jgi:cytochrome o ubiquinol oxidase subunit 1